MYPLWKISEGEMLEWLKRHAWKACKLQKGFRGSNPRLSAKILRRAGEVNLLTDTDRGKSFEQGASGSLWGLRSNPRGERRAGEGLATINRNTINTNNQLTIYLMKKVFATLTVLAMLTFGSAAVMAQEAAAPAEEAAVENVDEVAAPEAVEEVAEVPAEEAGGLVALHKTLKTKFIEGGAGFMALTLVTLVFGLALCIERIIYLSLSKTNTKKLLADVEAALKQGGIEKALEVCRNTRGPVASIFYQGLSRYDEGIDVVEKTVASYGGVQLGLLEKNLSWITLFIAIAPSLGFLGTIIGMIEAFDKIQQVGDISATVVAGGIKVALLTTLLGLIIAVVLQLFYNYILSLVEGLVNEMEDSSISLLDIVVEYDKAQKK